jgi:hypothetical protein
VLGQSIVVDNRGGAGGTLAAGAVATAAADGHTLLFDATSFVVAQFVQRSTPFNYERDFVPVGTVADVPCILAVPANAGVRDLAAGTLPAGILTANLLNPVVQSGPSSSNSSATPESTWTDSGPRRAGQAS